MSKTTEKAVTIRFPLDLAEKIKAIADKERRSFNNQVIVMLEKHIEKGSK
jgi:hypothetical protein